MSDDTPNIPFMHKEGTPPLHLREWTPNEYAEWKKQVDDMEWRRMQLVRTKEKSDDTPDKGTV